MRSISMLCVCLALSAVPGLAAPEKPMQQAPGYFRFAVGDFVVTALQDGVVDLGIESYQGLPLAEVKTLLERSHLLKNSGVPTSFSAYVVDTGLHRILVDAGNADCYGLHLTGIGTNLRAAGYTPDDIDIVVITHLHGDHFCGLATTNGKRAYPKATVWVAQEETDFWFDGTNLKMLPPQAKATFDTYGPSFRTFKLGETIAPGLRTIPTHGHTPGHTAFLFESRGASLLAWGDIVHNQTVQFLHPEVSMGSDSDRAQAVSTRQALFEQLAKDGTLIAGSHLPFPGIGHIRRESAGFAWVPVEFGPLAPVATPLPLADHQSSR